MALVATQYNEVAQHVQQTKENTESALAAMKELPDLIRQANELLPPDHPVRKNLKTLVASYSVTRNQMNKGLSTVSANSHKLLMVIQ